MSAPSFYEPYATAFIRGREIQSCTRMNDGAPLSGQGLPLHYFKRVPLLPRIQWALGVIHSLQPANLLDVGSGRGKFLWPLLDAFPTLPVTAVDADARRARDLEAVHLGGIERLTVRQADAGRLPFGDESFDVVTLLEVLEHIPHPEPALAEAARVARRALLISAPSRPDTNPEHLHLFTEGQLRTMLAACGITQVKVAQVPGHWVVVATVAQAGDR
ncbi:MAG: class I SAM-dependent methyltransferase [Caldilineaceae bacterium]